MIIEIALIALLLVIIGACVYKRKDIVKFFKKHKKATALIVGGAILGGGTILIPLPNPPAAEVSYYVSTSGSDSNDGTSTESPWQTIEKVNTEINGGVINQGDNIYFKRGDTWSSCSGLVPRRGGTSANPAD